MSATAQICQRHRIQHEWFERLSGKVCTTSPPCMSDAEDWEGVGGNGWAMEIDLLARLQAEAVGGGHVQQLPPDAGGHAGRFIVMACVSPGQVGRKGTGHGSRSTGI